MTWREDSSGEGGRPKVGREGFGGREEEGDVMEEEEGVDNDAGGGEDVSAAAMAMWWIAAGPMRPRVGGDKSRAEKLCYRLKRSAHVCVLTAACAVIQDAMLPTPPCH